MPKFLRTDGTRNSKLGRRRRRKQVWRSPKGRHNKIRKKKKSRLPLLTIGYSTKKSERGKIKGKNPIRVENISQLQKLSKNNIAVLGKVGKRKKLEIAKKAIELGIEIANLNAKKFLNGEQNEHKE